MAGKARAAFLALALCSFWLSACGAGVTSPPVPEAKAIHADQLWLAKVKNSTALPLLLPSNNPLRSLAEMAGKMSADYRQSVMDLLRKSLETELAQRGFQVSLPEDKDARFAAFSADRDNALRVPGTESFPALFSSSEILRWEGGIAKVCARPGRFQAYTD